MTTVSELFANLGAEMLGVWHIHSVKILQANSLWHNTAATEAEMSECAMLRSLRRQPCQFGHVAASEGRIHFWFLSDEAVSAWSDDEIAAKIGEEKRFWK
jgi:hypothetical protein